MHCILSTLIHSQDWVSVDSNLPYLTLVIFSGEPNYMSMRLSSNELTNVLLYGYSEFTVLMNRTIIEATLKYIKSTGRFKRN